MLEVFIVDDSPTALEVLKQIINSQPDMNVQYKCSTGQEALKLIPVLKPNIVCIDYFMPALSGVQLVEAIMRVYPVPILIISGVLREQNTREIFNVLKAGALDFVSKPNDSNIESETCKRILNKIRVLSKVMVVKRLKKEEKISIPATKAPSNNLPYELIIIGSSTGGPVALQTILKTLPQNFPVPIVCLQHISKGFLSSFIEWVQSNCHLKCKIAEPNERFMSGTVYFSPEDKNILFSNRAVLLEQNKIPTMQCPSIDLSMLSASESLGPGVLGIILTGMGGDGSKGLLAIRKKGGGTIAQSEESCIVFGMPKEAIAIGAAEQVLDLSQISEYLIKIFVLN